MTTEIMSLLIYWFASHSHTQRTMVESFFSVHRRTQLKQNCERKLCVNTIVIFFCERANSYANNNLYIRWAACKTWFNGCQPHVLIQYIHTQTPHSQHWVFIADYLSVFLCACIQLIFGWSQWKIVIKNVQLV